VKVSRDSEFLRLLSFEKGSTTLLAVKAKGQKKWQKGLAPPPIMT